MAVTSAQVNQVITKLQNTASPGQQIYKRRLLRLRVASLLGRHTNVYKLLHAHPQINLLQLHLETLRLLPGEHLQSLHNVRHVADTLY